MRRFSSFSLFILTGLLITGYNADAQYFGINKPKYHDIKFKVEQTPHFRIYNYLENKKRLYQFGTWAEEWAAQHEYVLKNQLQPDNPILLYNNQGDFQQTNAISGNIGVGTGGVTEAMKNRVILPLAFSHEQTHHVLGHELVHAFQYDMIINGDSTNIRNLQNLPLWMVEGMAEYMSRGTNDPFTAMWLRDAVENDDVPSFKKLDDPKYFPYRYGQAFWAYMTSKYGDEVIAPLFRNTAIFGLDGAFALMFGKTQKDISEDFIATLKNYYKPYVTATKDKIPGREIINDKNAGETNCNPSVSPNGKYIVFLSEKNIFSYDLYVANATKGNILHKLASSTTGGHIEELNFIESSGTWSPDSKQFAFIIFSKGRNELMIKDVESGKTVKSIHFTNVPALSSPAWSPDGKSIALVGMADGQTDLYQYFLKNDKLEPITNDEWSELQPAWSEDGKRLVYATDELTYKPARKNKWTMNIATLDLDSHTHQVYPFFMGADNLNPQFDNLGQIYFLSDRDGYRNIYKFIPDSNAIYQLTTLSTGITGITPYSPALSVSYKRDRMVYSYYEDHEYKIKSVRPEELALTRVSPDDVRLDAGTLPHITTDQSLVDSRIDRISEVLDPSHIVFVEHPYRTKIKLDMLTGGTGIGIGTNQGYGTRTGLAGGVAMLFSDMLGEHQIFANLALNGQIYDFGGQIFYLNRTGRWNWGVGLSHIPSYYSGLSGSEQTTIPDQNGNILPALRYDIDLIRRFEEGINTLVQYPFNVAQRVEFGLGYSRYHYRYSTLEEYYYYDPNNPFNLNNGTLLYQDEKKNPNGSIPGFNLFNVNTALVGDNAQWGIASPMNGWRYRVGVEKYFGEYDFWTVLFDARGYKFVKPVAFAARLYNYTRLGKSAQNGELYPLFAIDPTLVRGFLSYSEQEFRDRMGISYDLTYGSKIMAANFEVRLPFTGPEKLSLIKSKFLLTELALFFDSGIAFNTFEQFKNKDQINRPPVLLSTGVSLRVNLFGSIVFEPYYARTLNPGGRWNLGLNIIPGW
jgi:Tol biopolymer transport system component